MITFAVSRNDCQHCHNLQNHPSCICILWHHCKCNSNFGNDRNSIHEFAITHTFADHRIIVIAFETSQNHCKHCCILQHHNDHIGRLHKQSVKQSLSIEACPSWRQRGRSQILEGIIIGGNEDDGIGL